MARRSALALGGAGLLAVAIVRAVRDRQTPRIEYDVLDHLGDVEIRRYPPSVVVETVAPSQNAAFQRLFRYISGTNRTSEEISMTAPVESADEAGETISMTAPVESDSGDEGVRMAFYLPADYDYDDAPRPLDESVRLVERPGRVLAVRGFSWWATDDRVARKTGDLRSSLSAAGSYEVVGDPVLLRYEGPWVPPFLRTNEVAIPVRRVRSG